MKPKRYRVDIFNFKSKFLINQLETDDYDEAKNKAEEQLRLLHEATIYDNEENRYILKHMPLVEWISFHMHQGSCPHCGYTCDVLGSKEDPCYYHPCINKDCIMYLGGEK